MNNSNTLKNMKYHNVFLAVVAFTALFLATAFGQGNLTPTGSPAPTMKSLDQIEARTPIAFAGFGIGTPGAYYLTTNLVGFSGVNGINIVCDNVVIDLNGFTMQGVSGSLSGINISGTHTNIVIRNGTICNWDADGINGGLSSQNLIVEHMVVTGNTVNGIAGNNCIVSDCSVQNNQWTGIAVSGNGSRITRNNLSGNNAANHSNGAGILIEGSNNLIDDNFVTGSGGLNGIAVFGGTSSNVIIKNCVIGWGTGDYSIATFNDVGPISAATNSTSAWGNISH
jgi:parallel beta-helix repeat protein